MRLFQNSSIYPAYLKRLRELTLNCTSFKTLVAAFLADRYGAVHLLKPVLEQDPSAFFTNGDNEILQRQWAKENGLPVNAALETILLAQIEHHRTEVFYNLDPIRYGSNFVRKLPGCVRKSIAWRAAPSLREDLAAYDLMVSNFPTLLAKYKTQGLRTAEFSPAHDQVMNSYADNNNRHIDVLFVGGYSRHHQNRAKLLEAVAKMSQDINVVFHLDCSLFTRLAESKFGSLLPIGNYRRPYLIQAIAAEPVFGLDLYDALSKAKIVINGAIDMAGRDRGNMRCFEAMGCGSLLLSDDGVYPPGMIPDINLKIWQSPSDAVTSINELLADDAKRSALASAGHSMISESYSKQRQWHKFQLLAS
jgi:hypothetical protein